MSCSCSDNTYMCVGSSTCCSFCFTGNLNNTLCTLHKNGSGEREIETESLEHEFIYAWIYLYHVYIIYVCKVFFPECSIAHTLTLQHKPFPYAYTYKQCSCLYILLAKRNNVAHTEEYRVQWIASSFALRATLCCSANMCGCGSQVQGER